MAFETVGALLASKWGPLVVQGLIRCLHPLARRLWRLRNWRNVMLGSSRI